MQAFIGETVVADAAEEHLVQIEGNLYFPPTSVRWEHLEDSSTPYTCPWKGKAQYHDVLVGDTVLKDAAWSYPHITEYALARVGRDFSGYIAFDARQVRFER